MTKATKKIIVMTSAGELCEFKGGPDLRFWHEGDVCRVYTSQGDTSETLASFTKPISVIIEKL